MRRVVEVTNDRQIVKTLGVVGRAFFGRFRTLRDVQRRAIPPILSGEDILVASATASGKTEAIIAPLVARTIGTNAGVPPRVRVLLIAPTRALVNDLAARLETPLARLNLTLGRQTSDHKDKDKAPFVLITTPESLDSMLVRDAQRKAGKVIDHLLAGVSAVFIDEAHLFDGTVRGDQLRWLLGRLRRLRRLGAEQHQGLLQVCAGSATVGAPDDLARRLLGPEAVAVRVPGTREIEVFGPSDNPVWFPLEPSLCVTSLRDRLELAPIAGFDGQAERRIWQALSSVGSVSMRKVLVFVPTRKLSDTLSAHLAYALPRRRNLKVLAHHGSLARERREEAEWIFASTSDTVLVATTTLEVGVDIGDVDMVALIGAPPSTRSLLQRIGRAGRRIGRTRVLVLPRNRVEQAALASMLLSARDGILASERYARRWSVFVQQTASFVAQGRPRGRRRSDVLDLAEDVWPEESNDTANAILEYLLGAERLIENRGRFTLGESWADAFDQGASGMHANLSSSGGVPVVDASTGEIIARVGGPPDTTKDIALGGQRWDVSYVDGELLLKPKDAGPVREGLKYTSRSAPTGLEYAVHVRRGLGFEALDAPFFNSPDGPIWLHFGGSAYQTLLCCVLPTLRPAGAWGGLAINGVPGGSVLDEIAMQEDALHRAVDKIFADLEPLVAVGPYQRDLPDHCRRKVVEELVDISAFQHWLRTRRLWEITRSDPHWNRLHAMLPVR